MKHYPPHSKTLKWLLTLSVKIDHSRQSAA